MRFSILFIIDYYYVCVYVLSDIYIYISTMGSKASYSNEVCRGCSFASLAITLT